MASQSENEFFHTENVSKEKEKKSEETLYVGKCLGFFFLPKTSSQFQCEKKNNINRRNTKKKTQPQK